MERLNKYQGRNLYVKNLDETVDDGKLREFFGEFGTITSARVMVDDQGNNKGFGFVCFSTPEEATRAVSEVNGRMLGSKPLYVGLAQSKADRKAQLEAHYAQRMQAMQSRQPGVMGPPGAAFAPGYYGGMPMVPQAAGRGMAPQYRGAPMPGAQVPRWAGQPGGNYAGMPPQQAWGGEMQGQPTGVQFTAGARNREAARQPAAPAVMPVPAAGQSEEERKRNLGDQLYPRVAAIEAARAGKITGMLLELDLEDLTTLLQSPQALQDKVHEAIEVLDKAAGQ
jgi:polyadenylate-binding protein